MECGADLSSVSLESHWQIQHVLSVRNTVSEAPLWTIPEEYHMDFPRTETIIECLVEGYPGRSTIATTYG